MLKEFSKELKETREKNDITLQTVAARTRIDMKFLEAIEEGNFSFLPDLYVKAFIKQYAKAIGLDENETIERYNIAKEGKVKPTSNGTKPADEVQDETSTDDGTKSIEQPVSQTKSFVDESTHSGSKSGQTEKQNPLVLGGSVLGIIVVSIIIYFVFFNSSEQIIVEEKPFEEVLQETPSRFIEEVTDTLNENESVSALEQISLTIANVDSVDSAWVYVIIDGISPEEFLLLPNISTNVTANNNFRFTLGNSGVIKLIYNNEEIAFDGKRGAVRHFKLDRNGLERIFFPPQIDQE